ncbi:MAG TPA: pitrilysin family protein [Pyrinomonadaceae bacterium]|nr:pitrilysin family protein [Pyrinomonadaceae bacterium]
MTPDFRKTIPQSLPPVQFNVPGFHKTALDNGLKIVVIPDNRLPLISYRLAFNWGDINDPEGLTGASSAVASMLNEGTFEYSSRQLADHIERLGASISVSASDDFTILAASTLSLYSSEILRLAAEMVLRPTFPEDELDLYRRNTVEHLKFQRSQPGFLANEQAARLVYGNHPYSLVSPSAQDIDKLTREGLQQVHALAMIPNNATFIVVGDVDREGIVREIEDLFGGWPAGEFKAPVFPGFPERKHRTLTVVDRPGSAQSNIVLANRAIDRNNPDYFPMIVMNQVLGAGASSRVFMNLREEKGYTYGAYTRLDAKRQGGNFEATAEVRTAVTGDSLKEFFYELDRIRDEDVPQEELDDAKNFLTGVFPIRAETQEGLTNLIVNQLLFDLPDDYLQTYRSKVEAIGAKDVRRVAGKYVLPSEMAIVVVGDAKEIVLQAGKYAEAVEIFDTEGNPIASLDQDAAAN